MATKDYIAKLADQRTIIIDASAIIGNETYHVVERFALHSPKLEITAPSTVKRNSVFNVTVNFRNPLKQTLTNCSVIVEGKGFTRKVYNIPDVTASAMSKTTLMLTTSRIVSETFVLKLYTQALKESVGVAHVKVRGKLVRRFRKYTRKSKKGRRPAAYASNRSTPNVTADILVRIILFKLITQNFKLRWKYYKRYTWS
ncbi:hypothetical protein B4U80_14133 [Leptotrombidium deliense]|uniref:Transglutaminase C-terminal domain-containing protein n=1 Tax=Leptotrombidium deliense TaxID=299467 RepID=A0A443S218_9ACAR|nr:hypothetical protein B4U80_14133 [Leptotrombidium deliense]